MFGKGKKKLDRRVRRRIRKTTAVLLLISAITIAAIPVPDAVAEGTITETGHDNSVTTTNGQAGGIIPLLDKNDKIYCTGDGSYQFAIKSMQGYNDRSILVGYTAGRGGSSALKMEDSMEVYVNYTTAAGTAVNDAAAANRQGNPLFYKQITQHTKKRTGNWNAGENKYVYGGWVEEPIGKIEAETSLNSGSFSVGVSVETDGTAGTQVQTLSYYTYKFFPCTEGKGNEWKIKNENSNNPDEIVTNYYLHNVASNISGSSELQKDKYNTPDYWEYCKVPDAATLKDKGIMDSGSSTKSALEELQDNGVVNNELIDDEQAYKENNKSWYYFKRTDDNQRWLKDIPVGCISNQRAEKQSDGTYKIPENSGSTGVSGNAGNRGGSFFTGGGTITSIELPYTLIAIADEAFKGCTSLATVTFREGNSDSGFKSLLNVVGASSFEGCTSLKNFRLPPNSDVNTIGQGMFRDCRALESFFLPTNVRKIGNEAFKGCENLKSLEYQSSGDSQINSNLTEIGNSVFEGCKNLNNVVLPNTLEKTGTALFKGCAALNNVTLPDNAAFNKLFFSDFEGCGALEWIYAPNDETLFDTDKGYLFDIEDFKEQVGPGFYIRGSGHRNCKIRDKVARTNGITFFSESEQYYEITMRDKENNVDFTYPVKEDVNNPGSGELLDIIIDGNTDTLFKIRIPEQVGKYPITSIGNKFQGNIKIKSVYIPSTVTTIAAEAFKGCYNLEEVIFQGNNVTIGDDAFYTQYKSPHSDSKKPKLLFVGALDEQWFTYAENHPYQNREEEGAAQTKSYIELSTGNPTNIHVKYDAAFVGNEGGTNKWIVTQVPEADNVMNGKYGEKGDEYYNAIEEALAATGNYDDANGEVSKTLIRDRIIGIVNDYNTNGKIPVEGNVGEAFLSAIRIELPKGVQRIEKGLFSEAKEDINTVKREGEIEERAKSKNDSIKRNNYVKEIIMQDIEVLDPYAFYGCNELETVVMYPSSGGGESIGDYAFGQCGKLKSVTLPSTLTKMGLRPFAGDDSLVDSDTAPAISFTEGVEGRSGRSAGSKFSYNKGIIYEDANGTNEKVVECLVERGGKIPGNIIEEELRNISGIYEEAFMDCNKIVMVDLTNAEKLTKIPRFGFANASALALFYLPVLKEPNKVSIDEYAFKDAGLVLLKVPNQSTDFGDSDMAFYSSEEVNKLLHNVNVLAPENSDAAQLAARKRYAESGWRTNDLPKYTYKFYDEDGKYIDERNVYLGDKIEAPDLLNDEKYAGILEKHKGMYYRWDVDFSVALQNMSVKAVWTPTPPQMWAVRFINDDGEVHLTREVKDGDRISENEVATPVSSKEKGGVAQDYKFLAWEPMTTDESGNKILMSKITGKADFLATYEYIGGNGGNQSGGNSSGGNSSGGNSSGGNSSGGNSSGGNSSSNGSVSDNSSGTRYVLTVVNGSGSGSFAAGTDVTISAYEPNTGYEFYNWTCSESDVNFSKMARATSFKMPAKNLTVTGNYRTKSETGNAITSRLTQGTVTSSPSSNTGSVSKSDGSNGNNGSNNGGSSVQVSRPGISDANVASATVNGSTDNFVVKVVEDGQATVAIAEALRNEYGSLENIHYFAMDISLYDETGEKKITDTSGLSVTVTLPIPDELRQYGGNNKVAAVTGGNNLEKLNTRFTTVNGVPCAVFTATHFSPYALYVDTANLSEGAFDITPKTGDMIHPKWFLAIGLALLSAVLFLKKDKKIHPEMA